MRRRGDCTSQVASGSSHVGIDISRSDAGSEDPEELLKDDLAIAQLPLTAAERLILANQYAILERIYPTLRHEYAARRQIVEQGAVERYEVLLSRPVPTARSGAEPPSGHFQDGVSNDASLRRPDLAAASPPRMWPARPKRTARTDRGGALTPW